MAHAGGRPPNQPIVIAIDPPYDLMDLPAGTLSVSVKWIVL